MPDKKVTITESVTFSRKTEIESENSEQKLLNKPKSKDDIKILIIIAISGIAIISIIVYIVKSMFE